MIQLALLLLLEPAQATVVPGPPLPVPPVTKRAPSLRIPMDGPKDPNDQRLAQLLCNSTKSMRLEECVVIEARPADFGPIAVKRAESFPAALPPTMPDGTPLGPKIVIIVTGTGVAVPARPYRPPTAPCAGPENRR
jgi:hypothetical protein